MDEETLLSEGEETLLSDGNAGGRVTVGVTAPLLEGALLRVTAGVTCDYRALPLALLLQSRGGVTALLLP
jgi:hypothetical protein